METSAEVALFVAGARVVLEAIADPAVVAAWNDPSALEEQTVGGIAGHLARGSVWVVGDYLDGGAPEGEPDVASPGEYFAVLMEQAGPADHEEIRERGAALAAQGPAVLAATLTERLDALESRLAVLDPELLVAVVRGRSLRLRDYLATRIVEQVVHLDDLARSVGREPFPVPAGSVDLVMAIAVDVARRRRGDTAVLRALYRGLEPEVFPAL